jgi:hypothetical protein
MILTDFRMHGAGPHRAGRYLGWRGRFRREIMVWIGNEPGAATRAAEMIIMARMSRMMRRCGRINLHTADRIDHVMGAFVVRPMIMPAMTMDAMSAILRSAQDPFPFNVRRLRHG